jgi:hypothetical protein
MAPIPPSNLMNATPEAGPTDAENIAALRSGAERLDAAAGKGNASAIARAVAMPLEERKDRWNAMMTALRANSIHHWTAHFLQALANDHEGKETDAPLIEDARLPATVGLSRTAPDRARLD